MSKLKHTPGPWHLRKIEKATGLSIEKVLNEIEKEIIDETWDAYEILGNNDELIATHVCGIENARLLAAAPRMLRVLLSYFEMIPTPVGKEIIEAATGLPITEVLNER